MINIRFLNNSNLKNAKRKIHKDKYGVYYTTYQLLIKNEFDFSLTKPKLLSDEIIIDNKGADAIVEMGNGDVIKGKLDKISLDGHGLNMEINKEFLELPFCHMNKLLIMI